MNFVISITTATMKLYNSTPQTSSLVGQELNTYYVSVKNYLKFENIVKTLSDFIQDLLLKFEDR